MNDSPQPLLIGWAHRDITPAGNVSLRGQFYMRITSEVRDPLTTTALALASEDGRERAIVVSIDGCTVPDYVIEGCRGKLGAALADFDPCMLFIHATHTHTAPDLPGLLLSKRPQLPPGSDVLSEEAYGEFLIGRICEAAEEAWRRRAPGAVSWARGYAVIGFNRRAAYCDGSTKMYGSTAAPEFSHIEGHEDHGVEMLFTYDASGALTGMIVNVPCPSQCTEHGYFVSADYWHETRQAIRRRHGEHLHILPQCSAAGDLSPRTLLTRDADARILRLKGYGEDYNTARRRDIADKLAAVIDEVLPLASTDIRKQITFGHRRIAMQLPRRRATEADLREAEKQVALAAEELAKLDASDPTTAEYSSTFSRRGFYQQVIDLYHRQQGGECLTMPVELHVLRIGDIAMCSNRFEYYLDFGDRIKGRSKALQTFVVQLAGPGGYLPSARSLQGGSYGAIIASTPIGPEGGQQIVDTTVSTIDELFDAKP